MRSTAPDAAGQVQVPQEVGLIGIVIPAHDEEALIGACLHSVLAASRDAQLLGEAVEIVVVADHCSDATEAIAASYPVTLLRIDRRNVGAARAAGAQWLLGRCARWLAFTDADTRVAPDWIAQQLAQAAPVVCGTVSVDDWSDHQGHAPWLQQHFFRSYQDCDGHRHIHGANLGLSALAYEAVGGFMPLTSSEDKALVEALEAQGFSIAWSAAPRVTTSARRLARAPDGFAAALCHAVENLCVPQLVGSSL